jgi:ABC-type uncharacterized transport system ATPase component
VDLKISGLQKYFSLGRNSVFRLSLPDLIFKAPSIVFVMGHNGSGKSVFLKLLAGDEVGSTGSVLVNAGDKVRIAHKAPIPVVRQNVNENLALDLTVGENLSLHLIEGSMKTKLSPVRGMKKSLERLLDQAPALAGKLNEVCGNLSLGQRQALAFLAVSARHLPLLLLDEFLASTDLETSKTLFRMAERYAANTPACLVIVSHDINLALRQADRILILQAGQLAVDLMKGHPNWTESFLSDALHQRRASEPIIQESSSCSTN